MYRLMQPEDKPAVLALWQSQRNESEEFAKKAIEQFAGEQNVYVAEENDEIAAVALAVPVTLQGRTGTYLYGLCGEGSLILAGLDTRFTASRQQDAVADACYAFLRQAKQGFATVPEDIPDGPAVYFSQMVADYDAETQKQRAAGLLSRDALNTRLRVYAVLRAWEAELRRAKAVSTQPAFDLLRTQFQSLAEERENAQNTASAALEAAFDFMEQAFAESQEMVVFVTELTLSPAAHAFITENGCERYFQYNKDLLLDHRKAALQQELAAEERRHGGI